MVNYYTKQSYRQADNMIHSISRITELRVFELKLLKHIKGKGVKVKLSHYRPGQALRIPGVSCPQISRQSAHEVGKVVNLTHRPPLHPRKYSWYTFLLEAESTPGP